MKKNIYAIPPDTLVQSCATEYTESTINFSAKPLELSGL